VTGKLCITDDVLHVHSCETGSAYVSGCKVDGRIARAASGVFSYSISGHACFYKLRKVVHFPSAFHAYCSLIMYSQIIEIAEVIQHQK